MNVVKVTNKSSDDVGFNFNGTPYVVPKKGFLKLPDFIAQHAVKVSFQLDGKNPLSIDEEKPESTETPGYSGAGEKPKTVSKEKTRSK